MGSTNLIQTPFPFWVSSVSVHTKGNEVSSRKTDTDVGKSSGFTGWFVKEV